MENNPTKTYIAIDLKSFYASVECVEKGLDPLTTNLVVADASRTEKTICLAVSPSLKAYGIPGRARLFEVVQKVKRANQERVLCAPGRQFTGSSEDDTELKNNPSLAISYHVATPRMAHYIEYSAKIYRIYLRYVAPEDMHVYSIDEVFIDATSYLKIYGLDGRGLARRIIQDILKETGITATAGVGTNLYLCKVAMDIVAKHVLADEDGVRIAVLDEMGYRRQLWGHRPLTDFWRVGRGYARKLESMGLFTMGDIARCSEQNEDVLYKMFGINAELLIDHAWGWEPCTISEIKAYKPDNNSLSSGQVLQCAYPFEKARVVAREMAEACALDLLEKGLVASQVVLTVGYDRESLEAVADSYDGEIESDFYGRKVPKHAHGTRNFGKNTSSSGVISDAVLEIFDSTVDRGLQVRRITVDMCRVIPESEAVKEQEYVQMDIFQMLTDNGNANVSEEKASQILKERRADEAMLEIRKKYGKNAVLKGSSYADGATGRERNLQIGGHKA